MRILSIALLLALTGFTTTAAQADLVVVVNSENGFDGSEEEKRTLIRRILLKEVTAWPDGTEAKSFVPKAASPAGKALIEKIYMLSDAEFEAHWARVKQTTGQARPREVGSSRIMLKLIQRDKGAIGVIEGTSADVQNDKLKILLVIPD